jgi:hypothetical protein
MQSVADVGEAVRRLRTDWICASVRAALAWGATTRKLTISINKTLTRVWNGFI